MVGPANRLHGVKNHLGLSRRETFISLFNLKTWCEALSSAFGSDFPLRVPLVNILKNVRCLGWFGAQPIEVPA